MDEDEDFLAAALADEEPTPVAQPAPVTVVDAQPEPVAEPPAPVEQPPLDLTDRADGTKAEPGYVPLGALLDTRDKLKAAEAQLAQFRAQPQQPLPTPDMFEEPEAFQQAIQTQIHMASLNTKLDLSEDFARGKYDDATVDAARDWVLQQQPSFQQEVLAKRNPYDFAVKEFSKVQALERLGNDPAEVDQFLAWKAAQAAAQTQPALQGAPPTPSAIPPRSLASAPGAGGVSLTPEPSERDIFEEGIGKR